MAFFTGERYLIHDRDPLYTTEFLSILEGSGIESVKLPPRAPNLNGPGKIRKNDQGGLPGSDDLLW